MGEQHWNRVKPLFTGALGQPQEQRDAWLMGVCPDTAVLAEVKALVASHEQAGDFLDGGWRSSVDGSLPDVPAQASRRFASGDRLGRYEIVGLLGAGGMGEVYRARDTRLNRVVVLKVLPADMAARPDWRARLEREARAVSSLSHPHVCALYDIGQEADVDFLVMEYLEGETLAESLGRGPPPR